MLNLAEIKDIQTQDITRSFLRNFPSIELSLIGDETPLENKELIIKEMENLRDWQWCFGKTLPFTKIYTDGKDEIKVKVHGGMVTNLFFQDREIDIADKNIKFKSNYDFSFFEKIL